MDIDKYIHDAISGLTNLETAMNFLKDGKEFITMNKLLGVKNIFARMLGNLKADKEKSENNKND